MKYCSLCQRYVEPQKKFSLGWFILGFGIFYMIYYILFAGKKYCPICKTNKLQKFSPEDVEAKKMEAQERKEARKEAIGNVVNAVKEKIDNKA